MGRYTKTVHLPFPNTDEKKRIARDKAGIFVVCSSCFASGYTFNSGGQWIGSHKSCKDVWVDIEHQSLYTLCVCDCLANRK